MPRSSTTGLQTRVDNSFSQPVFDTIVDDVAAKAYFNDVEAALNAFIGTSTTSLEVGTGAKTFTTQTGKAFLVGTFVQALSQADRSNRMAGSVTSYDADTGELVLEVVEIGGSGTLADWLLFTGGSATPQGSETVSGRLQLATDAETVTGTSDELATHPKGVKAAIDGRILDDDTFATANASDAASSESTKAYVDASIAAIPVIGDASETAAGKVELATAAETVTGTDDSRATHPKGVKAAIDASAGGSVASRTALKAVDTTTIAYTYLREAGRSGAFVWRTGDYSAQVAADTAEGIYLKADAVASSSGAWVRQFNGPWQAAWFGFLPSATATANTTALDALLALAVLADSHIEFQGGVHQINEKIEVETDFNLVLETSAVDACTIEWTNSDGGLAITYTDAAQPPTVRGFNLTTTAAAGGTALKVIAPDSATVTEGGALIEDVDCRGSDTSTDYWTKGIHCVDCWYPKIIRPDIKGLDDATSPFDMTAGIQMEDCQAPQIRDVFIFHCERGIMYSGTAHGEGLSLSGGEIVGVSYGIDWNLASSAPLIGISNLHINAYVRCIKLTNVHQLGMDNLLLYKTHVSTSDWQAIELVSCNHIQGSKIRMATVSVADTTSTANGITFVSTANCVFSDVLGFGWVRVGSLVLLVGSGTTKNKFSNLKVSSDSVSQLVIKSEAGSVAKDNEFNDCSPKVTPSFTSGDATPSVGNDVCGHFSTANASSTTITTLDDMLVGQEVLIHVNDVNTAWTNSSAFNLKGGSNIATGTGAGGYIRFIKRDDGNIFEVSRSF